VADWAGNIVIERKFSDGLPVVLSAEVVALGCLELKMVNVWVWKVTKKTDDEDADSSKSITKDSIGSWVECSAEIKGLKADGDSAYEATLCFDEGNVKKLLDALDGGEDKCCAPAAFFGIRLKEPNGGPTAKLWKEECFWKESWIFPVEVGKDDSGQFIRRGLEESGEIPNWKFLGKYFSSKGYPKPKTVIRATEPTNTPVASADQPVVTVDKV
jgi:hypothetical protein